MTETFSTLTNVELEERIDATFTAAQRTEHQTLLGERSRRSGFDLALSVECIIEAAQRQKFFTYGAIPDPSSRSWSQRWRAVPSHMRDIVLYCRSAGLPLLSSIVVEKENSVSGDMGGRALSGFVAAAREAKYEFDDDRVFLKTQQQETFAYAASATRVPRAYVITWKESGWPLADLEALVQRFANEPSLVEPWRMAAHAQCAIGDQVFALKQGEGPKVIFGRGTIVGKPSERMWRGEVHWMVPVRFDRLAHPFSDPLLDEEQVRAVLPAQIIRHQASGVTIGRSEALRLNALLEKPSPAGADWTERELETIVSAYFDMLVRELRGERFSKTESRAEVLKVIRRSSGAVEFKHQNISAVLHEMGKRWIIGYKPHAHTQGELTEAVESYLQENPEVDSLISAVSQEPKEPSLTDVFDSAPATGRKPPGLEGNNFAGRKYDHAGRDAANRSLGTRGEQFVVSVERKRLQKVGLFSQANAVCWVAQEQGDGLGYDVLSFDERGDEIYIEVKTTNGCKETPFFITRRELEVARRHSDRYHLYRIFRFSRAARIYIMRPPFDQLAALEPIAWRVWP